MGDLIVLKSDNTKLPEFEKTMAGLLAEKMIIVSLRVVFLLAEPIWVAKTSNC